MSLFLSILCSGTKWLIEVSGLCEGILYVVEPNLKLAFDVSGPCAQTPHPALYFTPSKGATH